MKTRRKRSVVAFMIVFLVCSTIMLVTQIEQLKERLDAVAADVASAKALAVKCNALIDPVAPDMDKGWKVPSPP